MNNRYDWKTWQPKDKAAQELKLAYMEMEAKRQASRTHGLSETQKAAYAQELFNDMKTKYMPNGVDAQPSALERALNAQPNATHGSYQGDPQDDPNSDSFVSIFDGSDR